MPGAGIALVGVHGDRVGRRRRLGGSRRTHAGRRRHALPRRVGQQDLRGDGAGAAVRGRQARSRRAHQLHCCPMSPSTTPGRPRRPCCCGMCSNTPPDSTTCTSTRSTCSTARPICRSRTAVAASRRRGGCAGSQARGWRIPTRATAWPDSSSRSWPACHSTSSSSERIFTPLEMPTSSFRLAPEDDPALAQGYDAATGPPVTPYRASTCVRLAPCITSASELGHFVRDAAGLGRA